MRRAIAVLLLACLGMMVPLAAAPLRFCLMKSQVVSSMSCPKCHKLPKPHEAPCCLEIDQPDATLPGIPLGLPPVVAIDLPPPVFVLPPVELLPASAEAYFEPIRGPDTPGRHRAVLGVWRL